MTERQIVQALGYLGAELAERGYLIPDFEQPILLDIWDEATAAVTREPPDPKEPDA